MKQLKALSAYLLSLELFSPEDFDSWAEGAKIVQRGKHLSRAGGFGDKQSVILFRIHYQAIFVIERYPHRRHPVNLLFAQVVAWLMGHDDERLENAVPEVDVEILDDETADIQIGIEFIEDVSAVPDPAGTISLYGEDYALADADLWVAEQGDVTT